MRGNKAGDAPRPESRDRTATCVKGIDIRAGSVAGTIEIVSADATVVEQIRARTREEAVVVGGGDLNQTRP